MRDSKIRSPESRGASGETDPSHHEVSALPRLARHRLVAAVLCGSLLTGLQGQAAIAVDPVPPTAGDGPRLDRAATDAPTELADETLAADGFQDSVVFSGLTAPIVVDFAADGRVFVAEKSGLIKVFDSLDDPIPSVWADIRPKVHDYWDRGLLGMALDPDFGTNGRLYVAYTHNAPIGGTAPIWPDGSCPLPPGGTTDGCVVSGRLSALTSGGAEQVLVEDWCQQFPSHSVGDIAFDDEGALYMSAGDGASFNNQDYGQYGGTLSGTPTPKNPCGDPPSGVGGTQTLPSAEGGALRAQDLRTTGDPLSLDGSVIRVNRMTGAAMPNNPLAASPDANTRRVVAHGLRNPFRIAVHPVSNELWIADVGWGAWEEINRHTQPTVAVRNFGWPCLEGATLELGVYDQATLCSTMTSSTAPHFAYHHSSEAVNGDGCGQGGALSGIAFYEGGSYPDAYDNAVFFADYSRDCMWVMTTGGGSTPLAASAAHFADLSNPVHVTTGPGGDLFYVDIGGAVRRIAYIGVNSAPNAVAAADPVSGAAPLNVDFDASASTDTDGDPLTYAWDFDEDGDGLFNDATGASPSNTYENPGTYIARVRVSDGQGGTDTDEVTINAGNTAPTASITQPSASLQWSVNQQVSFAGTGSDPNEGQLPASAMTWELILAHCPNDCHEHPVSTLTGISSGTFAAPDHEYPSHLILRLTVEDEFGASDSTEIELQPKTVALRIESDPAGLIITAGWVTEPAPFTMTAISGSSIELNAADDQLWNGFPATWLSWSDGGARTHTVIPTTSTTYRATFRAGFDDVPPGASFRADIAWLVRNEITFGCTVELYCPAAPVTREQMAAFLVRVLGLQDGGSPDQFTDIASSTHRISINRLAVAGITTGCTATTFCPKDTVTREEMASFLARALELSGPAPDAFDDDDGSTHEDNINRLAAAGVTTGCGPRTFCPTSAVTRGQMAAFLRRAFEDRFPS